jgi:hypothetical protein
VAKSASENVVQGNKRWYRQTTNTHTVRFHNAIHDDIVKIAADAGTNIGSMVNAQMVQMITNHRLRVEEPRSCVAVADHHLHPSLRVQVEALAWATGESVETLVNVGLYLLCHQKPNKALIKRIGEETKKLRNPPAQNRVP